METKSRDDGNAEIIENFIFSENNQQIKDAVREILEDECPYEPMLIVGRQGTGKSYLLNGIRRTYDRLHFPGSTLKTSGLDILDRMLTAIRQGNEERLLDYYRGFALILIDDIDDLADKRITLESFFKLVGTLSEDSIIVMTTTRELDTDRMERWMRREITELILHPLSKELFLDMMDDKFVSAGVKLSRKQREFLYVRSNKSVRSFDGVYNKILLNCKVNGNYNLSMNDLILYTKP